MWKINVRYIHIKAVLIYTFAKKKPQASKMQLFVYGRWLFNILVAMVT